MKAPVKLGSFVVVLAATFGVGFGAGRVAGPFETGRSERPAPMQHDMPETGEPR